MCTSHGAPINNHYLLKLPNTTTPSHVVLLIHVHQSIITPARPMSDATRQCTRAEERHRTVLQSLSCSKKMRAGKVSIKILFSSRMSKVRHELESRTRTSRTSRLDATSSRASPQMFTHPFHRKRVLVRRVRRTCHARHLQPTSENLYGRTRHAYIRPPSSSRRNLFSKSSRDHFSSSSSNRTFGPSTL